MVYIVIGIIVFVILIGVVVFMHNYVNAYFNKFALNNSVTLKKLNEINKHYNFFYIENFDEKHIYDNETFYDNIACSDYLVYQLQSKQYDILMQIGRADSNKKMYEEYQRKIKQIQEFGNFIQPTNKLNRKKLLNCEKKLFKQSELHPQTRFSIKIELCHSDLKGVIFNKKCEYFDADQIKNFIKKLNYKNGNFYKDREIWDSICKVERGKVSNKMRFLIYNRDGNRCCMCGRRENSVRLEIDHIKPISKGGKSTYDNLQTLCHDCNKIKGDTYL